MSVHEEKLRAAATVAAITEVELRTQVNHWAASGRARNNRFLLRAAANIDVEPRIVPDEDAVKAISASETSEMLDELSRLEFPEFPTVRQIWTELGLDTSRLDVA